MKNIVRFKITHNKPILIKHNGIDVNGEEVSCVNGINILSIEGSDFHVDDVLMFDMGAGELIKHATVEENKWTLEYEYPVFSWLHKILHHGWLLKEDNE